MRSRSWWITLLAAGLLAGGVGPLAGQGWIDVSRPGVGPLVRLRTTVTARVTGRIARVEVEEWFQNRGGGLAEGDYLYPLPGEAAFADLSLWQGDRELKGETLDAARARNIYEEIVRRRRDPALVELVGHGLLRARIFPITPGETRRVTIRYTQVLPRAGDALELRYAAGRPGRGTPGPRPGPVPLFRPNGAAGPEQQNPQPFPTSGPGDGAPIDLTVIAQDGAAFGRPFSPTHELRSERSGGQLRVRPVGELHGDVAIFLPLAGRLAGISLVTHRTGGEDGYLMITLSPGEVRASAIPRDITLVLDVSGSMSGDKLDQARRALAGLLSSLSERDRFRIVAFSSDVDPYRTDWTAARPAELDAARRWVDGLQAHGSTNIAGALREAFRVPSPVERLPVVVFLTDGLPTVGEQDPDRIAVQAERDRDRARVFAFGVGYDVNTRLLDRLTAAARGSTGYVEPGEDLERPLAQLAARIRYPVLTDLRLDGSPVELRDLYPSPLPDLFAGDELVLFGRYRGSGTGELSFSGNRAGRSERFATSVVFPAEARGDDYIPRLWAARKIGVLTRELRLHGRNAELENEIRDLGLRYGILTEFTAYLVQEPEALAGGPRPLAPQPAFDAMSGQGAVQSAETARMRRESANMVALGKAEAAMVASAPAALEGSDARLVAGRSFTLKDGVWTDALARGRLPVVAVEPFSPAYFDVLRALPELRSWCSVMEAVQVAGDHVVIRFAAGGARSLQPADIARLVRDFRRS